MEMNQDVKEILLKQWQLLQEESEKTRQEGDACERPRNLACLSEAMAQVALSIGVITGNKQQTRQ